MSPEGIDLVDNLWVRTDLLFLTGPEDAFSTYIMWKSRTRELSCWYINLQEPVRRTSFGIDTLDNILDIVVSPDMTQWNWKDTDEFEEAQKLGLYSKEKARQIWAEGEKQYDCYQARLSKSPRLFSAKFQVNWGCRFLVKVGVSKICVLVCLWFWLANSILVASVFVSCVIWGLIKSKVTVKFGHVGGGVFFAIDLASGRLPNKASQERIGKMQQTWGMHRVILAFS